MGEPVIVLSVSGAEYLMNVSEAGRLLDYLRAPNDYVPDSDPGMVAAAAFLERLVEGQADAVPPLTAEEYAGLLIALGRMSAQEGLPPGLAAVHEALLGYVDQPAGSRGDG